MAKKKIDRDKEYEQELTFLRHRMRFTNPPAQERVKMQSALYQKFYGEKYG
jgi:hypothetical protein